MDRTRIEAHLSRLRSLHDGGSDARWCLPLSSDEDAGVSLDLDLTSLPIDEALWQDLRGFSAERGATQALEDALTGQQVNASEERAALHSALRLPQVRQAIAFAHSQASAGTCAGDDSDFLPAPDEQILSELCDQQQAAMNWAERFRKGQLKSATGASLRHIIHIGMGGADQGNRLVWNAFSDSLPQGLQLSLLTDAATSALQHVLKRSIAEHTAVVVNSKSFGTIETLRLAEAARQWLRTNLGPAGDSHIYAVSANTQEMTAWGILPSNQLNMPEHVCGRFSVWSAAGIVAMVILGASDYLEMLRGAWWADVDTYRRGDKSAAATLAQASWWYASALNVDTRAIFHWDNRLESLTGYCQQLEMESLGKGLGRDGKSLPYPDSAVLWGGYGPSAQHSVFQLLHQGSRNIPIEMVLVEDGDALCTAQAEAQIEALQQGSHNGIAWKHCPGHKPVIVWRLPTLSPRVLGGLLATWENRVCFQAALLGINAFDQWGVELAKSLTRQRYNA